MVEGIVPCRARAADCLHGPLVPHRSLQIVRANANRSGARSRGLSTPGVSGATGANAARATVAAAAAVAGSAHGGAGANDDAMSDGSACTADEDAFDVVEAFDEGASCICVGQDTSTCPAVASGVGAGDVRTYMSAHAGR